MLRRLHHDQPADFAFSPANHAWAEAQIRKYPEGRQASAVIALLFRAQEQEGWLTRPAIEHVADMLDMPRIRVLEVATFYFMFKLEPVGSVAHVQVCGTLSCLLMGSDDLIACCRDRIADEPGKLSADGRFSWEEVECLGACANAPMVQIGKDYYEDLTPESLAAILDEMAAGGTPVPGPQNGRYAAEPLGGLTTLREHEAGRLPHNASVTLALEQADGIKRIDGTEVPLSTPWIERGANHRPGAMAEAVTVAEPPVRPEGERKKPVRKPGPAKTPAAAKTAPAKVPAEAAAAEKKPEGIAAPRGGQPDNLQEIEGIGPVLERLCHEMGIFHFDQIAAWGPGEVAWMDGNLKGFRGRITRDKWVAQAKLIVSEGVEAFRIRAKTNDY